MNTRDIEYATFALGRFVQYRLDEGMQPADLEEFMQAYLNLRADLDGRAPLAVHELQLQTEVASPANVKAGHRAWPSWFRRDELARSRYLKRCSAQSTTGLHARS